MLPALNDWVVSDFEFLFLPVRWKVSWRFGKLGAVRVRGFKRHGGNVNVLYDVWIQLFS